MERSKNNQDDSSKMRMGEVGEGSAICCSRQVLSAIDNGATRTQPLSGGQTRELERSCFGPFSLKLVLDCPARDV